MATGQLALGTVKLGDNADTSKNFLIKTPAVADGSLSIQTESGVPVFSRSAAGVITLGAGQTWQDVIGSRVSGTTYTNNTGLPITVSVTSALVVSGGLTAVVGGLQIAKQFITSTSTCNACLTFPVPAGATYSVTVAVTTIATWVELR